MGVGGREKGKITQNIWRANSASILISKVRENLHLRKLSKVLVGMADKICCVMAHPCLKVSLQCTKGCHHRYPISFLLFVCLFNLSTGEE